MVEAPISIEFSPSVVSGSPESGRLTPGCALLVCRRLSISAQPMNLGNFWLMADGR
jgi:hypothetical protein